MIRDFGVIRDFAPAKINLFLHVLGRREDGYHLLESLVSFADFGDDLSLEVDKPLGLEVAGPFGFGLAGDDNLILRAARAFVANTGLMRLGRFKLVKNLPVASGIGGGSSDAAAALRLLARANDIASDDPRIMDAARTLGADVPVCLDTTAPRLMQGIGHALGNRLHGFRYPALLVNPCVPVETRAVFAALQIKAGERYIPAVKTDPQEAHTTPDLTGIFSGTRNDLEAPSSALQPVIAEILAVLRASSGCSFARMSGSGATCFAIFETRFAADKAASVLHQTMPDWWTQPCTIKLPS